MEERLRRLMGLCVLRGEGAAGDSFPQRINAIILMNYASMKQCGRVGSEDRECPMMASKKRRAGERWAGMSEINEGRYGRWEGGPGVRRAAARRSSTPPAKNRVNEKQCGNVSATLFEAQLRLSLS
jgi:hypothetical protein